MSKTIELDIPHSAAERYAAERAAAAAEDKVLELVKEAGKLVEALQRDAAKVRELPAQVDALTRRVTALTEERDAMKAAYVRACDTGMGMSKELADLKVLTAAQGRVIQSMARAGADLIRHARPFCPQSRPLTQAWRAFRGTMPTALVLSDSEPAGDAPEPLHRPV